MSLEDLIDKYLPRLRWRGLTIQLFLLLVLPLTVLGLIVIFASLNLHENAMRTLVGQRAGLAVRAAANALSEQLSHRAITLQTLALRVAESDQLNEIMATSDFLLDDFDSGLAVFSRAGELLASSGSLPLWQELQESETDFLLPFLGADLVSAQILPAWYSSEQEEYLVLVLASEGKQSPIVAGIFSLSFAREILTNSFSHDEKSSFFLFNEDKQIILRSGSGRISDSYEGLGHALAGESGSSFVNAEGQEVVVAYAPVTPPDWALVSVESWESISSPLLRSTQAAPLLLVPVVLFSLLALWFEAKQIVQPLKKLETQAAALSWGDYEMIDRPVGGIEEIKRLQQELVHLSQKVRKAQGGLRSYIGAITAGQEEERRRLSNELHDDTIQSLIALNQRVQLAQLSSLEPETNKHLAEIQTLLDQTIGNLRRLVRALRPLYLEDLGLSAALDMLSREASQNYNLPIDFRRTGKEIRLLPDVELALYRIAQEGLSNINRHAGAKQASVELAFAPHQVILTLQDNGRGFQAPESPAEFAPSGHFGLLGIHEKAERMGAKFVIKTSLGKGTELIISLPLG